MKETTSAAEVRPAFFEAVEKWADLDFGADLRAFLEEICYTDLVSYAQLIHHKDSIVAALLRSLDSYSSSSPSSSSSVSLPALFDFSSALARDLRSDFHPHFWPVFDAISNVFLTAPGQQRWEQGVVEHGTLAMGQMVRVHFQQFLAPQLKTLFKRIFPLLAFSGDDRVRASSVRSFAFLLPRLPDPVKFAKFLFAKCAASDQFSRGQLRDGVVQFLFFGIISEEEEEQADGQQQSAGGRGGEKGIEARTGQLLDAMIEPVISLGVHSELSLTVAIPILSDVLQKCLAHSDRSTSAHITSKLLDRLKHAQNDDEAKMVIGWLLPWVSQRKGGTIFTEGARLMELVGRRTGVELDPALFQQYLQLVSELILSSSSSSTSSSSPSVQSAILTVFAKFDPSSSSSSSSSASLLPHLPSLLSFLIRLRFLPLFFPWCMNLVGPVASSFLRLPCDSAQQLHQLQRQWLTFYGQIHSDNEEEEQEELPTVRPPPLFDIHHHCTIRKLVVAILREPAQYPDDFFDLALNVWPRLWRVGETPEALDEVNAFVVDTVRKGEKLSDDGARRLWVATRAVLLLKA